MLELRQKLGLAIVAIASLLCASVVRAEPWSFGIIPDTQWSPSDARAAKGVPVEIIADVNRFFIQSHVRFVVAVGDICQNAKTGALDELDIRKAANQDLEQAGIRFLPVRGNHDGTTPAAADYFDKVFPGLPGSGAFNPTGGFVDEGSPKVAGLAGKSYAFTYNNATLVLVDTFTVNDGSAKGTSQSIESQLPWVESKLADAKSAGRHAFFVSHKNLLGQHHKDNIFGTPLNPADPGDADIAKQPAMAKFYKTLIDNDVHLYFSGHDHMYLRSLVKCPGLDAPAKTLQQVITGSCSYKFYEPNPPYSTNETPLVQQRNAVGFIIVTIDGPKVTVSYYSTTLKTRPGQDRTVIDHWQKPDHWELTDSFGYNLHGKSFALARGESLTSIVDESEPMGGMVGSSMAILDGVLDSQATTLDDSPSSRRPMSAQATTGWTLRPQAAMASDVLSITGLRKELNHSTTSRFVLSMKGKTGGNASGMAICSPDGQGKWVCAAALDSNSKTNPIAGPWKKEYPLGSYGYDEKTDTFWAVLDHEGDFVIARPQP